MALSSNQNQHPPRALGRRGRPFDGAANSSYLSRDGLTLDALVRYTASTPQL